MSLYIINNCALFRAIKIPKAECSQRCRLFRNAFFLNFTRLQTNTITLLQNRCCGFCKNEAKKALENKFKLYDKIKPPSYRPTAPGCLWIVCVPVLFPARRDDVLVRHLLARGRSNTASRPVCGILPSFFPAFLFCNGSVLDDRVEGFFFWLVSLFSHLRQSSANRASRLLIKGVNTSIIS